ncbi:MAG: NUDIX hydrolase [Promethearchaeota archaeon]|jgi:8-oxo-dGTP pyrophosphatase MutT (NUDIX family)
MPIEPKIASTVVLLRNRVPDSDSEDNCEFEVFMAKRHQNARFMSEHHVFPGGGIDDQDLTEESRARLIGIDNSVIDNLKDVCEDPANLWIIAIRELFEETGILIATNETGSFTEKIQGRRKKFKKYQRGLQKKRKTMTGVLTKEDLFYAADNLRYFGRLITPPMSPIRFDTQFFICKFPQNQSINLFKDELTESLWGSPKQLLTSYKKREIKLIFPQYSTLQRLSKFKTVQEVFDSAKKVSSHNRLNNF